MATDLVSNKIARILLEDFGDGMAQLRGSPRIRLTLQVRHLDSDGVGHLGKTRDIGAKGFSAVFSVQPPLNTPVFLQIHSVRDEEYPWIDLVGEVIWLREEADGVVCGVAFIAAQRGAADRLSRLLSSRVDMTAELAASGMRAERGERKEAA